MGAQYEITFVSLEGKEDFFNKWCWQLTIHYSGHVSVRVYLVSDSFLVLLLCSDTGAEPSAGCIFLSPLTNDLAGFQSVGGSGGYVGIRRKGADKVFLCLRWHPERELCLFIFMMASVPVQQVFWKIPLPSRKSINRQFLEDYANDSSFRLGSPRHRLWDKGSNGMFGNGKVRSW